MTVKKPQETYSRRRFLATTAALAMATYAHGEEQPSANPASRRRAVAYVGTYTGAVGNGSNGEGIYLVEMDPQTGALSPARLAAKTPNPSWIAIHPSKKYLYAVNEIDDFRGNSGSVTAFAMQDDGDLRQLNVVSSAGAGPAYLSLDATGSYAFVANYGGGSVAVLPVSKDGSLQPAVDVHRDSMALGSTKAADAPPGSFAISGHDAPHAHMIAADPQNKFVLATDLGQDRIYIYRLDLGSGKLTPHETAPYAMLPSGDGPRHFTFHPNGRWLYSIQEESSTIVFFDYAPGKGTLAVQQTLSALPAGFAGSSFASEILVSPEGKFLYAANRLHDTIAAFAIGADGKLTLLGESSTLGDYPGQCRIEPNGNFLYVCNRRSDSITSFWMNHDSGLLTFSGQYASIGSPASITFLP
ncbi:Putative hemagglutinin-related protein [Acidisarcina polymorpha]|uniref:Hemagglutinin-related protein n=1 Tax=Acidisarcina polymorpha TaxID=2211140 RepID=A0A2Z5G0Z2_9BACT|nr:lactonase family protein [Acidisarcina polymorpha]AXC12798.1 Putative hemagglutinin-related protein [Acidisarcina polymorpha]